LTKLNRPRSLQTPVTVP